MAEEEFHGFIYLIHNVWNFKGYVSLHEFQNVDLTFMEQVEIWDSVA